MESNAGTWFFAGALLAFLIALAAFLPTNPLTGNVVVETCDGGVCLELCDAPDGVCGDGLTCCATSWDSGVCAPAFDCERINEASAYSSIEMFQDGEREAPPEVDPGRLVWPLLLVGAIIGYFVLRRRDLFSSR